MERMRSLICRHLKNWMLGIYLATAVPLAWATDDLAPLRAQFVLPDDQVDFAPAKLAVDKLIDPTTDIVAIRHELDRWELVVHSNVPEGANARQTLEALLKTLYQPGP